MLLYFYSIYINKLYDGDTASDIDIDLGFGVTLANQSVRFALCDTPEVKGKEKRMGLYVRDHVVTWLNLSKEDGSGNAFLMSKVFNPDTGKYGRILGEIYRPDPLDPSKPDVASGSVNHWLLSEGMAWPTEPSGRVIDRSVSLLNQTLQSL